MKRTSGGVVPGGAQRWRLLPLLLLFPLALLGSGDAPPFGPEEGVDQGDGNARRGPIIVLEEGLAGLQPWRYIAYRSDIGMCVELWTDAGGAGGCGLADQRELLTTGGGQVGTVRFVSGSAADAVASVRLHLVDGRELVGTARRVPGEDSKVYVFVVPDNGKPRLVIGYDAQGDELARAEV